MEKNYLNINSLKVSTELLNFVNDELLKDTDISPEKFWSGFDKSVNELTPKNKELLEMIDIGGPTLIRAASKNYEYITPIVQIEDYQKLVKNLNKNNGKTDISFRKKMAYKVFSQTSNYDKIIAKWLYDKK